MDPVTTRLHAPTSHTAEPISHTAMPPVALYPTEVRHLRRDPVVSEVRSSSYWWLVDADALDVRRGAASLPTLPRWTRPLASIRPADLGIDVAAGESVGDAVRRRVRDGDDLVVVDTTGVPPSGTDTTGTPPSGTDTVDVSGRVLVACTGRVAGYGFDPLSVVWCHDGAGAVTAVVAIVRNTYGGLHHYVVRPDESGRASVDKEFFVSPFHDVSGTYRLSVPSPGERITVGITLEREGTRPFSASVSGRRREVTTTTLLALTLRRPLEPLATAARIRAHGIRLWTRRLPLFGVPDEDRGPRRRGVPEVPRGPRAALLGLGTRILLRLAADRLPVRIEPAGGRPFGGGRDDPSAPRMLLHRPTDFAVRTGVGASIGFGESYMAGDWSSPEPAELLTEFARELPSLVPRPLHRLRRLYLPGQPRREYGTVDGAAANISAHYDLSDALFALFLDETMTYSSALFPDQPRRRGGARGDSARRPTSTRSRDLAAAQNAKIDALLDAAGVGPGTRVLEIGTGWGELCVRAAARGAHLHSVTLSAAQRDTATRRVAEAGYADRVQVDLCDYRHVDGRYDAVVSVEMLEAVGLEHLPEYFRVLDRVLGPGGRVVLQTILMDDDRVRATRRNYTWVHKYVFPGGRIPSTEAVDRALAGTRLRRTATTGFGLHYAQTLRLWRERFDSRRDEVAALGFDETFRRMWRFYLAYSEAGFRSGYLDVAQITLEADQ